MARGGQKTDREVAILEAAWGLFVRHGVGEVTIDQIASVSRVGKGTVYNYFVSKDELSARVFLSRYSELMDAIRQIDTDQPVIPLLRSYMMAFARFHLADKDRHQVLSDCQARWQWSGLSEATRRELTAINQTTLALSTPLFQRGIREQVFREASITALTRVGISMFLGILQNLFRGPGDLSDEEVGAFVDLASDILISGLRRA